MNKFIMIAALATLAGSAFAADSKLSGLNLRLGLFFPTDSATRDFVGESWFGGGIDYKIKDMDFGTDSLVKYSLGLSVDWFEKEDVRTLPVLLTLTGSQGKGIYWLGGAGFSFNKFPGEDETKFAWTIGAGYEMKTGMNPISLELRYQGNARKELAGWAAYVGFKF